MMKADEIINFVQGATNERCSINDSRVGAIMAWDRDADGKMDR